MTSKKPTRRRSHPVTKRELVENNPNIADEIDNRATKWRNRALTVAAIGAAIGVIITAYTWSGLPVVVTDRGLDHAIGKVKVEVNSNIDKTKDEVVKNQNVIKSEITGSLSEITKSLNGVVKSQTMATMDQLDMQTRLAFTQKQTLQGQLATVNQALQKDQNDQLALTRKMQLEDFIKQNDAYMQDAQQKMTRLRSSQ